MSLWRYSGQEFHLMLRTSGLSIMFDDTAYDFEKAQERFDMLQPHGGGAAFFSPVALVSSRSIVESVLVTRSCSASARVLASASEARSFRRLNNGGGSHRPTPWTPRPPRTTCSCYWRRWRTKTQGCRKRWPGNQTPTSPSGRQRERVMPHVVGPLLDKDDQPPQNVFRKRRRRATSVQAAAACRGPRGVDRSSRSTWWRASGTASST